MMEALTILVFVLAITISEWTAIATLILGSVFVPLIIKFVKTPKDKQDYVITSAQNAQEILRGTNEALYNDLERERELRKEWQRYSAGLEDVLEANNISYKVEERP